MKISESELRIIIRKSLLNEVTSFGQHANYDSIKSAADCPFFTEIPAQFAYIFNSPTAEKFVEKIIKIMPVEQLKSVLGIGLKKNEAGIVPELNPLRVAEIMKSNNVMQILAAYFNSYLALLGTSCVAFLYLGKILATLSYLLGNDRELEAAAKRSARNGTGDGRLDYKKGIGEAAKHLARRDRNAISFYPFYVLPRLAAKGPNHDDVDLLKKDLQDYQDLFDELDSVRDDIPDRFFSTSCRVLNIKRTNFFEEEKFKFSELPKDRTIVDFMRNQAKIGLLSALVDAIDAYLEPMKNNSNFKQEVNNFLTRNNVDNIFSAINV